MKGRIKMSSSIDWFDCPLCGEEDAASREQDNRSCRITFGCSVCNWDGNQTEEEIAETRENLETWLKENENSETLFEIYKQHLHDKREIEPKYDVSLELFMKKYFFKVVNE